MADSKDLAIVQGKTFSLVLRWETEPVVRKAITGISFTAGAPRLDVASHGAPDGWRVAVTRVKGPKQINAASNPPAPSDYHAATSIDANTIELNEVSPYDEAGNEWPAYVSGGFIEYWMPVDLTGYTARSAIKTKSGIYNRLRCTVGGTSGTTKPTADGSDGTVTWVSDNTVDTTKEWASNTAFVIGDVVDLDDLMFLGAANSRIAIDATAKTITLTISAADTAAIAWTKGVYDLEMVSPTGVVTAILSGKVTVTKEVTT